MCTLMLTLGERLGAWGTGRRLTFPRSALGLGVRTSLLSLQKESPLGWCPAPPSLAARGRSCLTFWIMTL